MSQASEGSVNQSRVDEQVQGCLAIESDDRAFSCLKHAIKDAGMAPCRPEFVLLTKQGCPFCEEEKKLRKLELERGEVRQVDVSTPEGKRIAAENGVDMVPAMLLLDCNGKLIDMAPPEALKTTPEGVSAERLNADLDDLLRVLDSEDKPVTA